MRNGLPLLAIAHAISLSWTTTLAGPTEYKYSTKYDKIDVDAVIRNERLLNQYVGCLLDQNSCTPDGAELKKNLPDALQNACSACSEDQKNIADKIAHHLIDEKPEKWQLLEEKYDPGGEYRIRYQAVIAKETTTGASEI